MLKQVSKFAYKEAVCYEATTYTFSQVATPVFLSFISSSSLSIFICFFHQSIVYKFIRKYSAVFIYGILCEFILWVLGLPTYLLQTFFWTYFIVSAVFIRCKIFIYPGFGSSLSTCVVIRSYPRLFLHLTSHVFP